MKVNRVIGQYTSGNDGPTLVFVAGIHGNETSGVLALQQVFDLLNSHKPQIHGKIIGVAGNLRALDKGVRFVDIDLNRVWLREDSDPAVCELNERDELSNALGELLTAQSDEVYFFDLHATSSESTPFIMLSDTIRNRDLARMVGVPMVLGLLEHLKGMLIDVTSRSGFPTILFQGGRDKDDSTVVNHMGLIWKVLQSKCLLDRSTIPESQAAIESINSFASEDEEHEFYEILFSKKLKPEAELSLNAGYKNFQPIQKNDNLGALDGRELKAPFNGQIFMPLYQDQGEECFYIVRRIAAVWIRVSRRFRLFRYHNKLHWLLGVKKINKDPLTYRLDEQITFFWALEIFHLLGYIKVWQDGPFLYMTRREDERNPPTSEYAIFQFTSKGYLRSELKNIKVEFKIPFSNV